MTETVIKMIRRAFMVTNYELDVEEDFHQVSETRNSGDRYLLIY